uniref:G-protein coupled receptor 35-like n=1 Tax=Pristiophorus japonicus TaxID=55135 RepID=UPI00398ED6F8
MNFLDMTEQQCFRRLGLSCQVIADSCSLLEDELLPRGPGGHALTVAVKITTALNFFTSASFQDLASHVTPAPTLRTSPRARAATSSQLSPQAWKCGRGQQLEAKLSHNRRKQRCTGDRRPELLELTEVEQRGSALMGAPVRTVAEGDAEPPVGSDAMNCEGSWNQTDLSHQVVLLVFSLPTIVVGSTLNGVALCIICYRIKARTKPLIYMANLVFSDVFLLFALPFKILAYYIREEWPRRLGKMFCQFLESLCFINTYASILLITLICVDRYIAITHPFLVNAISSPKRTAIICASIWAVVWSASIYIYFTSDSDSCFYHLAPEVLKMGFIAPLGVLFLICAFIMMFCSLHIVHRLKVQASETQVGWLELNKSAKIILSNLMTFLICFTPYQTILLLYSLTINGFLSQSYCEQLRSALHFSLYLANVNCCLDAIYYFYGIKELCQSSSGRSQLPDSNIQLGVCETLVDSTADHPLNSQSR